MYISDSDDPITDIRTEQGGIGRLRANGRKHDVAHGAMAEREVRRVCMECSRAILSYERMLGRREVYAEMMCSAGHMSTFTECFLSEVYCSCPTKLLNASNTPMSRHLPTRQ